MRAPYVRVYAGSFPPGTDQPEARWDTLVASLRELARQATEAGATLVVENHFNTVTASARLTDEVRELHVRILYDQANLTFQGDEEYTEAIPIQAGRIALARVKDFVWKDGAPGFSASKVFLVSEDERKVRSREVGERVLPWDRILRALAESGADGRRPLEYERRWYPQDLPPAEEGMRGGVEHARHL